MGHEITRIKCSANLEDSELNRRDCRRSQSKDVLYASDGKKSFFYVYKMKLRSYLAFDYAGLSVIPFCNKLNHSLHCYTVNNVGAPQLENYRRISIEEVA